MKIIYKILFLCGIIGITAIRCERYKIETDPAKAILGKWEIIEIGNWPNMEPYNATGYIVYSSDSIVRAFEYDKQQFTSQKRFWIDSLLHESVVREDGFVLLQNYKYQFFDNKLRLDYVNLLAIYNTFIYKRIN